MEIGRGHQLRAHRAKRDDHRGVGGGNAGTVNAATPRAAHPAYVDAILDSNRQSRSRSRHAKSGLQFISRTGFFGLKQGDEARIVFVQRSKLLKVRIF